jgi:pyroglutamyl-peptidase
VSRHVLLTGFEPFGPHRVNPSELLVRSLDGRVIGERRIVARVLPAETRTLRERLEPVLRQEQPEFVLGTGYAAGSPALALERLGINVLDFELPDTAGVMRKNDPIQRGGPDARLATLPLAEIVEAWTKVGVPGYVSNTAGTFVCNQWLYEVLGLTANAARPIPAGFVHLPALPAQALELGAQRTPSMTLELMRKGIETAIETIGAWLESKPAPTQPMRPANQVWIPRGLREVER